MNSINEINEAMEKVNNEICEKGNKLAELREQYQTAKAIYENMFAKYLLETKALNPEMRVQEIKAMATNLAYTDRINAIKAESQYRRAQNEFKALELTFEGLREASYGLRAEIKRL